MHDSFQLRSANEINVRRLENSDGEQVWILREARGRQSGIYIPSEKSYITSACGTQGGAWPRVGRLCQIF